MPSTNQAQVKRWMNVRGPALELDANGTWVKYSDYQALQAALGEALDGWRIYARMHNSVADIDRIAELRKLTGEP